MSHFTVLVIGDDVDSALAPYDENNTDEQYLVFEDESEETEKEFKDEGTEMVVMPDGTYKYKWDSKFLVEGAIGHGSGTHKVPEELEVKEIPYKEIYGTYEKFMKGYHGRDSVDEKTGKYGYWTNPNGKWDWFSIGGRWAGSMNLKEGVDISKYASPNFSYGWGEKDKNEALKKRIVDSAFVEDIDFVGKYEEMYSSAIEQYNKVVELLGGRIPQVQYSWSELWKIHDTREKVKEAYDSQKGVIAFQKVIDGERKKKDKDKNYEEIVSTWDSIENYRCETAEEYAAKNSYHVSAFAIVNEDGWHSEGDMGWWGMTSATEEEKGKFKQSMYDGFIKDLPKGTRITMVDCHV